MPLYQVTTRLGHDEAQKLVDLVMELTDIALSASAYEHDEAADIWIFEAHCDGPPPAGAFEQFTQDTLNIAANFKVQPLKDQDWIAKSLQGLKPVSAGGFYVHGSHDAAAVPNEQIPILIDAAQAFGTGHHETTAGCLTALADCLSQRSFSNPLDLGCGSGLLAIALAKRLDCQILATDIDPLCITATIDNARKNNVGNVIQAELADGFGHPIFAARGPFDLIVANILAKPLIDLAPDIAAHHISGGTLVLSGLLEKQIKAVQTAFEQNSYTLSTSSVTNGWAVLTLHRA